MAHFPELWDYANIHLGSVKEVRMRNNRAWFLGSWIQTCGNKLSPRWVLRCLALPVLAVTVGANCTLMLLV